MRLPVQFSSLLLAAAILGAMGAPPAGAQDTTAPRAVAPGSSPASALVERAGVALRENQFDDARRLYEQALKLDPANQAARDAMARMERFEGRRGDGQTSGPRRRDRGTSGPRQREGMQPTAAGGKGGATPQTQDLSLDTTELVKLRKAQLGTPEFRGAWVTRMDWARRDPTETRQNIVRLLDSAKDLHINALLWQVRGECATLYPSPLEPTSRLLGPGDGDLAWDPLKFAIEEAHKRGIEFHAYFNVSTCSDERNGPTDKRHVWFSHCQPDSSPNWLVHKDGKPAPFNEYWWLNNNLPEAQTYVRRAAADLVARYEVDGLHYDRVRFPSSSVSDDPWSKARFAGDGNPTKLEWQQWQRENLNRLVADIYAQTVTIRPKLKVSAAVWGIYDKTRMPQGTDRATGYSWASSGLQDYNQDSIEWINRGSVDALVPMIYWDMGANKPDFDELTAAFVNMTKSGRHIYGGQRVFSGEEMLRQAVASRLVGAKGQCPFTLNGIARGCAEMYKEAIYPDAVPTPEMYWKTKPTRGIILVTVKDTNGAPVTDAQVRITGRDYVWLSSADGFCGVIDAELDRPLTLTAIKGGASSKPAQVRVAAAKSAVAELVLPAPKPSAPGAAPTTGTQAR